MCNTVHKLIAFTSCEQHLSFKITDRFVEEIHNFFWVSDYSRCVIMNDLLPVITVHIGVKSPCICIFQRRTAVGKQIFYKGFISFLALETVSNDFVHTFGRLKCYIQSNNCSPAGTYNVNLVIMFMPEEGNCLLSLIKP